MWCRVYDGKEEEGNKGGISIRSLYISVLKSYGNWEFFLGFKEKNGNFICV